MFYVLAWPMEHIGSRLACIVSGHFNTKLTFMYAEAKPGNVETNCQH